MTKRTGRYEAVSRGVSQQPPHDRRAGQQTEQINMISDPVRGIARRPGSLLLSQQSLGVADDAQILAAQSDAASFKAMTFYVGDVEHALFLRTGAKVPGSVLPLAVCINKATGEMLPLVRPSVDTTLDLLDSGGASAYTTVGRFIYVAGASIPTTLTTHADWANPNNSRLGSVWIRAGAYSRTYRVTLTKVGGGTTTLAYTTKASSYPGVLDTSGVVYSDPEYTKKVTDITNAYNSTATAWVGQAAADINPQNIAAQLVAQALAAGHTGVFRDGAHILIPVSAGVAEINVDDGGDGTAMRAVGAEILDQNLLTNTHFVGKIVKVRPKTSDGTDAYYLKAVAKVAGVLGWTGVLWQECAGERHSPTTMFCFGTVKAGTFYIASTATGLGTLISETIPGFTSSATGDLITNPVPQLFGNKIDYLGVFQDRLVVGSKATLLFSKNGDYLNFFKQAVLTEIDDDPIEVFAYGGENDTITSSVYYDRNLVLFGRINQYSISGRATLTPQASTISVMTAHKDATSAPPVTNGNLIFFGTRRDDKSALHQVQTGITAETPETASVSQQLSTYLEGAPVELAAIGSPNMIFLRTSGLATGIYVYSYLDTPAGSERLWDSWHKWTWDSALGVLLGMVPYQRNLLVLTLRVSEVAGVKRLILVSDKFQTATDLNSRPYLDSAITLAAYRTASETSWISPTASAPAGAACAFSTAVPNLQFVGTPLSKLAELDSAYGTTNDGSCYVGMPAGAYTVITNPYVRDRDGKAVLTGRLTISKITVTYADSGGFTSDVTHKGGRVMRAVHFVGRILGNAGTLVGQQPISSGSWQFTVGKETRECSIRIMANTWLPLTITSMEWYGQHFRH